MMKKTMVLLMSAAFAFGASCAESVKIVSVGWHQPSLEELAKDVTKYENQAPFDGVCFGIGGSSDVFNPEEFSAGQKSEMAAALKTYQSIKFTKWKYNFLSTLIDQNVPQWFDDTYWKNVTANFNTAAQLAKEGGFAGICLDPEEYGTYPVNSYYNTEYWLKTDTQHTAAQYLAEARKRGRQIGEAIFATYPEMVFWSFYFWSFGVDMMGEFCNGLLEAMPAKAKLVDGDEWNGYIAQSPAAYETMKAKNQTGYGMLDDALKSKHLQQGGLAPSFYLDAYASADNDCLQPTINTVDLEDRAAWFETNLKAAKANATGGHVWIYGEDGTWWPTEDGDTSDWDTLIPGIREVVFRNTANAGGGGASEDVKINVKLPAPKVNIRLFKSMK